MRMIPLARTRAGLLGLLLAGGLAAAPEPAAGGVAGEATISAPATAEVALKASTSLRILGLPVEAGRPVAGHTVLVHVDVSELERELADAQNRLRHGNTETRHTTELPRDRGSVLSQDNPQLETARETRQLHTLIVNSPVRAPVDGYFVRSLLEVGMSTKKRKPAALFVPLDETVLVVKVPAADAASLAGAREVVVRSTGDPAREFRGELTSSTPDGDRVVLRIRPVELPFLVLGAPTPVTVAPAR
jgi:multidrug efflux pump subunit AcrA (membrane-fusion protein)